jgi:hypothetical protein
VRGYRGSRLQASQGRILDRGYAVGKIPEPALVDRGSSRRFLVMRYPTRANQHDHRHFCPTRPSIPSCVGKNGCPEKSVSRVLTGHSISATIDALSASIVGLSRHE